MIQVENLYKDFSGTTVLKNLNFHVSMGELFGFLGPNGAGKTTTINILTGRLKPTKGKAFLDGLDTCKKRDKIKSKFGIVFENITLHSTLTVKENLYYFCELYGVSKSRADFLMKLLEIEPRRDQVITKLSKGLKQRVNIARGLIPNPEILFLDEPTVGLDVQSARSLRETVKELNAKGLTIFLTTHIMEEAEFLCERIAIINNGQIVADGSPECLRNKYGQKKVEIKFKGSINSKIETKTLSFDDAISSDELAKLISKNRVVDMSIQVETLEEAFLTLTGRKFD